MLKEQKKYHYKNNYQQNVLKDLSRPSFTETASYYHITPHLKTIIFIVFTRGFLMPLERKLCCVHTIIADVIPSQRCVKIISLALGKSLWRVKVFEDHFLAVPELICHL